VNRVLASGRFTVLVNLTSERVANGLAEVVRLGLEQVDKLLLPTVHQVLLLGQGVGPDITPPVNAHLPVSPVVAEVNHRTVAVLADRRLTELQLPHKLSARSIVADTATLLEHRKQEPLAERHVRRPLHVLGPSRTD